MIDVSAMSGVKSGVREQMRVRYPDAIYIYCWACHLLLPTSSRVIAWPFSIEPLYHKCSMFDVITVTYIQVQLSYCCLLCIRNLCKCFKINLLCVFESDPYEVA